MKPINGKVYPLWGQFIDRKNEWIGGILQEVSDSFPQLSPDECEQTEITDIVLRPNGSDSAFFEVFGKDYSCGGDVEHIGITAGEEGWITISGYGGHVWRFKQATSIPTTPNQ
jgi:hypothetical protein